MGLSLEVRFSVSCRGSVGSRLGEGRLGGDGVDCLESNFEMSSCGGWGRWRKRSLTEGSVSGAAAHKRQLWRSLRLPGGAGAGGESFVRTALCVWNLGNKDTLVTLPLWGNVEQNHQREKSAPLSYSFRVSVLITRTVAWYWQQECGKGRSHGNGPGGWENSRIGGRNNLQSLVSSHPLLPARPHLLKMPPPSN